MTYYYPDKNDTFGYWNFSTSIYNYYLSSDNSISILDILFAPTDYLKTLPNIPTYTFALDKGYLIVVKFAFLLRFIGANSFLVTSLVFGFICFLCTILLYKTLRSIYPEYSRAIAWIVFFVPSVTFWSSGIMKDTITFSCICLLNWAIINIFYHRRNFIISLIIISFAVYLVFFVKTYILVGLLPALLILIFRLFLFKIKDFHLKLFVFPITLAFLIVATLASYKFINIYASKFSIDRVVRAAQVMQNWHLTLAKREDASSYDLGKIEMTPKGIATMGFKSYVVTFFRPYLWEVRNPVMLMTAVESFLILIATFYILLRSGIIFTLRKILSDPFLLYAIIFTIVFGIAVGFASFNFGALARYKIPCVPFYLMILLVCHYSIPISKLKL